MMRATLLIAAVLLSACSEDPSRPRGDGVTSIDQWRVEGPPADRPLGSEPAHPTEKGTPPADKGKPGEPAPNPFPVVSGKITYYDATGDGACMFGPSPNDLMVGAMNQPQYLSSEACGACAQITGPLGTITVRIVDLCPECQSGHIDLSQQAFAKLADPKLGVVNVTWRYVPCPVTGPIAYRFKEGSSQWWTAIQVRNTRYAVKTLEAKQGGSFVAVPRLSYNYFVAGSGLGVGPYELRVTDVLGHQLVDTGIALSVGQVVPGAAQFPP
jgi:expansin